VRWEWLLRSQTLWPGLLLLVVSARGLLFMGATVFRSVGVFFFVLLRSTNCFSGESIYLTASDRIERFGLGDGYTYVAPYFTGVDTQKFISITKVSASDTKAGSSDSQPQGKASQASISFAGWQKGAIRYAVNCDLSLILKPGDTISITGVEPKDAYSGAKTVVLATQDSIIVAASDTAPPASTTSADASVNSNCPAAKTPPSFAVQFGITTTPKSRAYLYVSRNAFFNDNINVSLDSNGMLSNSDSSSTQQVTSILTELAQTAGLITGGVPGLGGALISRPGGYEFWNEKEERRPPPDPRQKCFAAIGDLLKSGPYYVNYPLNKSWQKPATFAADVALEFVLKPLAAATGQAQLEPAAEAVDANGKVRVLKTHSGLVAFYPVPARATLACVVNGERIYLAAPSTMNLYISSEFVDPKRDFLTGPQDTFSFAGGVITGHKFSDQSAAKTIADTITSPLRALVPSVSVTQQTQVQSSPGKPDTVTQQTQTTTGAPKFQ
jgi:hypothetical protein